MMKELYHGTNDKNQAFTKDSCFTDKKETANEYSNMWAEIYGKSPIILKVKGEFEKVGGPDEYKLIKEISRCRM